MRGVVREYSRIALELLDNDPDLRADAVDDLGARLEIASSAIGEFLDQSLERVTGQTASHSKREFERLGVRLREAEPPLGGLFDSWRATQIGKIRSLTADESRRLGRMLREREGAHPSELRALIQDRLKVTRSKAELLARDQVLTLNAKVTESRFTAAGITEYEWTTSGDERVRDYHKDLDGKRFRFDQPPVISPDGRTGNPGDDYQCRCTAFPVIPEPTGTGQTPSPKPARERSRQVKQSLAQRIVAESGGVLGSGGYNLEPETFKSFGRVRQAFRGASATEAQAIATGRRNVVSTVSEIQKTAKLPPIEVSVYRNAQGVESVALIDGRHRAIAAREAGATHIRAKVIRETAGGTRTETEQLVLLGDVPGGLTIEAIEEVKRRYP